MTIHQAKLTSTFVTETVYMDDDQLTATLNIITRAMTDRAAVILRGHEDGDLNSPKTVVVSPGDFRGLITEAVEFDESFEFALDPDPSTLKTKADPPLDAENWMPAGWDPTTQIMVQN